MGVGGHVRGVSDVSYAADGIHLAVACNGAEWSIVATNKPPEPRELVRGVAPNGVPFQRIALSPCAKRLVGATATNLSIFKVDGCGGRLVDTVSATGHAGVTALSFGFDGVRCLSAGEDGRLRLWKVEEDEMAGRV